MDLQAEELQSLSATDIVKESISIPKVAPRPFYLITLTLIFPLSFAILVHSLFTHPLFTQLSSSPNYRHGQISDYPKSHARQWTLLISFQFLYLIFLFIFSLLSTAAVVFTVASLYTSKPVSFSSTISAVPKVFSRLFITFMWVSLLMTCYNLVLLLFCVILLVSIDVQNVILFTFSVLVIFVLFGAVHIYITALWHLASVVSVLEPLYGLAAMKKGYNLLKGKTRLAVSLVTMYLLLCGFISVTFGVVVVRGGDSFGVLVRIVVGGLLVGVLVIVNLVGLLVQSVFYYVCKGYHHQGIDKSVLLDHLGGYLGEYVPLKSSVQMENLEA